MPCVNQRVVDLHDRERPGSIERTSDGRVAVACRLTSLATCHDLGGRPCGQPESHSLLAGRLQAKHFASTAYLVNQNRDGGLLACEIILFDTRSNHVLDERLQATVALLGAAGSR